MSKGVNRVEPDEGEMSEVTDGKDISILIPITIHPVKHSRSGTPFLS